MLEFLNCKEHFKGVTEVRNNVGPRIKSWHQARQKYQSSRVPSIRNTHQPPARQHVHPKSTTSITSYILTVTNHSPTSLPPPLPRSPDNNNHHNHNHRPSTPLNVLQSPTTETHPNLHNTLSSITSLTSKTAASATPPLPPPSPHQPPKPAPAPPPRRSTPALYRPSHTLSLLPPHPRRHPWPPLPHAVRPTGHNPSTKSRDHVRE